MGKELARVFETGSEAAARSTSSTMRMPLTSSTSTSGGRASQKEREDETPGNGLGEEKTYPSDSWHEESSEFEGTGVVNVKPTTKRSRKIRQATVKSVGMAKPLTRSRGRSLDWRSSAGDEGYEAESSLTLISSLWKESTKSKKSGNKEESGQLFPPQHHTRQRDLIGNSTDSLHAGCRSAKDKSSTRCGGPGPSYCY